MPELALTPMNLINWWDSAHSFFEEHAPSVVPQLTDDARRLARLYEADRTFYVCVLGQSAVGKSTLLNAIVAGPHTVLPAGGIGPLTALATEVRYSEHPYLRVTYRRRKQFNGFRLRLETEQRNEQRHGSSPSPQSEGREFEGIGQVIDESDELPLGKSSDELTKQLTQIICGSQFENLTRSELIQGVREILGQRHDGLIKWSEENRRRIEAAFDILARTDPVARYSQEELGKRFDQILQAHVTGHLAPLVERIEVGYPSAFLQNEIVLVDLPGIGVANDSYRSITSEYVRLRASAVVLVVDRSGPSEATVELIRDSGYWDRLLLSSSDPETDPCQLVIAVTKIDDLASEEYLTYRSLPKDQRPKVAELFAALRPKVRTGIRAQAESSFLTLGRGVSTDEDVSAAREAAHQRLLKELRVFPVSATEYRALLEGDEELRAFIRNPDESGVPEFASYLEQLAAEHRRRVSEAIDLVALRFTRSASSSLEQVRASWTASRTAAAEAVELRSALSRFLEPRREELATRTGAFREFLETAGQARIGELVAKAQLSANQEIDAYLRDLRTEHWAILRATVTRGGSYLSINTGRRVDLAADVAQRFQEPIAGIWSQTLLQEIRERTRKHSEVMQNIVQEICEWAAKQLHANVQHSALAAQQQSMADRAEQLGQVGSEAIEELKDAIKRDLMRTIEPPIRKACEEFRDRGDAQGPGVKKRILRLFSDLAADSVREAAKPAVDLLRRKFIFVQSEIAEALETWGDPIQQASEAVVQSEQQASLRQDLEKQERVLKLLDELIEGLAVTA